MTSSILFTCVIDTFICAVIAPQRKRPERRDYIHYGSEKRLRFANKRNILPRARLLENLYTMKLCNIFTKTEIFRIKCCPKAIHQI